MFPILLLFNTKTTRVTFQSSKIIRFRLWKLLSPIIIQGSIPPSCMFSPRKKPSDEPPILLSVSCCCNDACTIAPIFAWCDKSVARCCSGLLIPTSYWVLLNWWFMKFPLLMYCRIFQENVPVLSFDSYKLIYFAHVLHNFPAMFMLTYACVLLHWCSPVYRFKP